MASKKKNRWLRYAIIVVIVCVAGYVGARSFGFVGQKKMTEVITGKAKYTKIVEKVSASGKVQPEVEVKISPDVSGEIVDIMVQEGDSVVQGQLLLRIRPDNIRAAVENAAANLNSRKANIAQSQADLLQRESEMTRSKAEFDRQTSLYEQKVISEADYQLSRMNYEVAQQRVESAKQNVEASKYNLQSAQATLKQSTDNLSRTEIYAPVSGSISKLSVEKGEKVVGTAQMSGTEMLIIANLTRMEVRVNVNENDIVRVRLGQEAEIEVDSYANRKFKGVVTEIANTAKATATDDAVTEFQVKVRILNESYKDLTAEKKGLSPFRPGMTATVDIITNTKDNVLAVPLAAVVTRSTKEEERKFERKGGQAEEKKEEKKGQGKADELKQVVFLYDEKQKKVKKKEVKTGISDFENIEILEGVADGEELVTGPFATLTNPRLLKDNDEVKKIDPQSFGKKNEKK
ncbi:MAG TPA: efflux transporter periplasmic adaptor subunit [Microscillaceae bacterium]|nr:efflux transporter periplasmic adaptor subunit [Microscillaceae bacterium]